MSVTFARGSLAITAQVTLEGIEAIGIGVNPADALGDVYDILATNARAGRDSTQ